MESKTRPQKASTSKSFSRYEPRTKTPTRSRASTLSNEIRVPAKAIAEETIYPSENENVTEDVFEKRSSEDDVPTAKSMVSSTMTDTLPDGFDELPIELISLTDRFIASLTTAKIYSAPPTIEKLCELFQDFYLQAESHIATHIQALSTKQFRDASPAPSVSSRTSANIRTAKLNSPASRDALNKLERTSSQQMLTPGEISERRKARRLLEHKRIALQEAVERKVCEGIYDRIWRHKGTLDQIEDEKLRSKTAALALVGIGLKELGIDMGSSRNNGMTSADRLGQVEESIFKASESLVRMNESRNPLGKLQRLATTHQIIVDLLSNIHQSSSSADEILPTLIYTLIISPAEGINVISNLRFIQRFRSANKIDGEAAYCLTNLEAAITFLETVDLATLQTDEVLEETPRPIQTAPLMEEFQDPLTSNAITQAVASSPVTTPLTAVPTHISAGQPRPFHIPPPPDSHTTSSPPVSPSQQRRLSSLFQPPVGAFGAASDAVRNTADQGFRSVGTALDSSFKLLFGRLKEQHVQGTGSDHGTIIVPKTLDDARRLVSPKPLIDEDGNISEASSFTEQDEPTPREDRLLEMITGTRQLRDRSVDSAQSNSSNSRRLAFLAEGKSTPSSGIAASPAVSTPTSAVDSMRSLGNTLNPLNRLAGINVMRGFGRSSTTPPALANPAAIPTTDGGKDLKGEIFSPGRIQAPIQKFLDVGDAGELKLSDVEALLKDYQRLAGVVKGMGLC